MMAPPSLSLYPGPAERYTVLLDLARSMAASREPDEVYEAIHTQVHRVLPASSFTLALGRGPRPRPAFHVGPGDGALLLSGEEQEHLGAGDFVLRARLGEPGLQLLVPLLSEGGTLGYVVAARGEGRPFDAADAHFLLAVGRLAGIALENVNLFGEARRRREEAELLANVSRELGASLEIEQVVARVADRARQLTKGPATVWSVEGRRIRAVAVAGRARPLQGEERRLPAQALAPVTRGEYRAWAAATVRALRAALGLTGAGETPIPLVSSDRLVGVLVVGQGEEPLAPEIRALAARMAAHAASALENARLHAEVRQLSLTDPLCGLPNRRQLDLVLEREFFAAQRGRALCLVLYDLDRFKEYNDSRGHQAGDAALIRFASVLRTFTRAMNLPARYGGEEFAAVLSDTTLEGGRIFAEKVRRRLSIDTRGALSVSAGVAAYAEWMRHPAELLAAADRALYRAKESGRDRVQLADPRPARR